MNDDLPEHYMSSIEYFMSDMDFLLVKFFNNDSIYGFQKQDVESDTEQLECESIKLENAEVVDCEVLE